MVVQWGGGLFLMSEVPLYEHRELSTLILFALPNGEATKSVSLHYAFRV